MKFQGFLWSCYPDSNRGPHPYQLKPNCFFLLLLVVSRRRKPLKQQAFSFEERKRLLYLVVFLRVGFYNIGVGFCVGFYTTYAEAREWIIKTALGKRNLTPPQWQELVGRLYKARRSRVGAPKGNTNAAKQCTKKTDIEPKGRVTEQIDG